jgi:hypothetical protein
MSNEVAKSTDSVTAGMVAGTQSVQQASGGGVFTIQCFDKDGNLKWEDSKHNLVVNTGLQDMNTQYFKGSAYTAAFFLGLITGPGSGTTYAAADTLASHAGWTEFTNYSGARKALTFGTATTANPSVISNTASPSAFTISGAGGTVAGAFLCTVSSGTSGTLFSEADFQSPGDRAVVSGDTLNVVYTFSLTAS